MSTCSCGERATWIVFVYANAAMVADHLNDIGSATDQWASCDDHLARSTRLCAERSALTSPIIRIRPERIDQ